MELLTRIQDNWIVLLIPAIGALVGWFTNVVAIKMMFHPVKDAWFKADSWWKHKHGRYAVASEYVKMVINSLGSYKSDFVYKKVLGI